MPRRRYEQVGAVDDVEDTSSSTTAFPRAPVPATGMPPMQSSPEAVTVKVMPPASPGAANVPWGVVYLIYAIIATSALALSAPTVFLPDMVEKRFHFSGDDAGMAIGSLAAAFSFGAAISSFFLGHLSDLWGRKSLIVLGLFTNSLMLALFGITPTYFLAILNRLFEGLLNGNIVLCKGVIADLVPPGEGRRMAFGYFGASFSLARAFSSALSGFVYSASPSGWLKFALPCFVAATPVLIVLVFVMWKMPNTRGGYKSTAPTVAVIRDTPTSAASVGISPAGGRGATPDDEEQDEVGVTSASRAKAIEMVPLTAAVPSGDRSDRQIDEDAQSTRSSSPVLGHTADGTPITEIKDLPFWPRFKLVLSHAPTRLLILIYSLHSFGNGSVLVAMVMFLSLRVPEGGGGMSASSLGIIFGLFGLWAFVFQVLFYKRLTNSLGALRVYRYIGTPTFTIGALLMPMASLPLTRHCYELGDDIECDPSTTATVISWIIVIVSVSFFSVGFMTSLPCVHLMLSNVARPEIQGLTQGLAQSSAATLRALGPFVSGMAFSAATKAGAPFALFVLLATGYATCFALAWRLNPRDVESRKSSTST